MTGASILATQVIVDGKSREVDWINAFTFTPLSAHEQGEELWLYDTSTGTLLGVSRLLVRVVQTVHIRDSHTCTYVQEHEARCVVCMHPSTPCMRHMHHRA